MLSLRSFCCLPLGMYLLCAAGAWAQTDDTLTLSATQAFNTDSNLFRLPDDANTQALIGRSSGSETVAITTLGLRVSKAYSLQRLSLNFNLVDYRYQNFDYLSFTARNYDAAWQWSLTPHLRGTLSTERNEALNDFADYRGFRQRNQRTNTATRFSASYELNASWYLLADLSQADQTNQLPVLAEADDSTRSQALGVRYLLPSGNSITLKSTRSSGDYLNRPATVASLADDGFDQSTHSAQLFWAIGSKLRTELRVAQVQRSHNHFGRRDYRGATWQANLDWDISNKFALQAGLSRELSSYQTLSSNYSQTDRFSVGPSWRASPKTMLRLRLDAARRSYLGQPTSLPESTRVDDTVEAVLSFDWQPYTSTQLGASLHGTRRHVNQPNLDYRATQGNVFAKYSF